MKKLKIIIGLSNDLEKHIKELWEGIDKSGRRNGKGLMVSSGTGVLQMWVWKNKDSSVNMEILNTKVTGITLHTDEIKCWMGEI